MTQEDADAIAYEREVVDQMRANHVHAVYNWTMSETEKAIAKEFAIASMYSHPKRRGELRSEYARRIAMIMAKEKA